MLALSGKCSDVIVTQSRFSRRKFVNPPLWITDLANSMSLKWVRFLNAFNLLIWPIWYDFKASCVFLHFFNYLPVYIPPQLIPSLEKVKMSHPYSLVWLCVGVCIISWTRQLNNPLTLFWQKTPDLLCWLFSVKPAP